MPNCILDAATQCIEVRPVSVHFSFGGFGPASVSSRSSSFSSVGAMTPSGSGISAENKSYPSRGHGHVSVPAWRTVAACGNGTRWHSTARHSALPTVIRQPVFHPLIVHHVQQLRLGDLRIVHEGRHCCGCAVRGIAAALVPFTFARASSSHKKCAVLRDSTE